MNDFEQIITKIANNIYSELEGGYSEIVYHKAMEADLQREGLFYESESCISVLYKGITVGFNRIDLVIYYKEKKYIVELKAIINEIGPIEIIQLKNYLKMTKETIGYIINFPQISKVLTKMDKSREPSIVKIELLNNELKYNKLN